MKPLPKNVAQSSWLAHRKTLRNNILYDDPEKFLTWPVIKATMFVADFEPVRKQLIWLLNSVHKPERILQENDFGQPETFWHTCCGEISGNLVNQLYYLKKWQYNYFARINKLDSVVEFGGGYGAMALICQRLKLADQYTIIDLPEYLLLQEYYLSNVLDDISHIKFVNTFDDYEIDADLMISICSLSEVDEPSKNRFFEQVEFNHHLVVFQPDWEDWDNRKYFTDKFGDEPITNRYFTNHQYMVE